jgi:transcriptional regulator with XRE-family HTH domain
MPKPRKLTPDAYVVIVLRSLLDMSQAELGEVCRVSQAEISKYELGTVAVPEAALRRMAERAKVDWSLVSLLRRFFTIWLSAADRGRGARAAGLPGLEIFEPALLAMAPYLIEEDAAEAAGQSPEEARREAEEIWTALERYPIPRRRELLGYTYHAARSCALMARICEASAQAAARDAQEARELADLALFIAGQVPEDVRSRAEGYCWAHLANARRAGGDIDGAEEAFALAWKLWQAGAHSELLPERRLLDLEASLRRGSRRGTST